MARAVKKVSRTSTRKQKRENSLSKKWRITIVSVVALLILGLGIGLGVYFGTRPQEKGTYVSDLIYFSEPTKTSDGAKEVNFTKENYATIKRFIKTGNNIDHIFIFAYDGSAFYADKEDEVNYNEEYTKLIARLADLQYEVDQAKAKGIIIDFYIVDTNVDNAVNKSILSDSDFGALVANPTAPYQPVFIYLSEGDYKENVKIEGSDEELPISTATWDDILSTSVNNAVNYIHSL